MNNVNLVTFSRGPIGNVGNLHQWLWGAVVGQEKIKFIDPVDFFETLERKGGIIQSKDNWANNLCKTILGRPYSPIFHKIELEGEDYVSGVQINGSYQKKEFSFSINPKTLKISSKDAPELSDSELQGIVRRLKIKELIAEENEKRAKAKQEREKEHERRKQEREKDDERRQIETMIRIWDEMI